MRVNSCIVICVLTVLCAADTENLFKKRVAELPLSVPEGVQVREGSLSSENVTVCQRRPLDMNLTDILNVEVIVPMQYDVGYCQGQCPTSMPNNTNHMLTQFLDKIVPRPCCVPTEFSPLSVLYYDGETNVVLGSFKDMKVKSCGCR